MPLTPSELETLLAHEARYFEIWSHVTQSEQVWFLDGRDMPDYHSANRALRLRNPSETQPTRGVEPVVAEIIGHYRSRGLPVVVDVDPIAEEQGFGRALRQRGVTPVVGSTLLMRYAGDANALPCPPLENSPCTISLLIRERLPADNRGTAPVFLHNPDVQAWIDLAGCDEDNDADARFWRRVAEREAGSPDCRLYLAHSSDGTETAVGACQLFSHNGWGLIDSVITHPRFRRRSIATRLVAQAVRDSQAQGNTLTYLHTERDSAGEQVYRKLGFEVWGIDVLRRHILF